MEHSMESFKILSIVTDGVQKDFKLKKLKINFSEVAEFIL